MNLASRVRGGGIFDFVSSSNKGQVACEGIPYSLKDAYVQSFFMVSNRPGGVGFLQSRQTTPWDLLQQQT